MRRLRRQRSGEPEAGSRWRSLFRARRTRVVVAAVPVIGGITYFLAGHASGTSALNWPLRGNTQVDEVHLTWSGDPETTMTVNWRSTPWSGNSIAVEIGRRWRTFPARAASPSPVGTDAYEEAEATGLRPGTTYPYLIRARGGTVIGGAFTTAPPRAVPFRFDAFADQGDCVYSPAACRVIAGIAADRPAFVLGAGDLSYANDHGPGTWDQWLDQVQSYAATAPLMPTTGNHEFVAGDPTGTYRDPIEDYKGRFALPGAANEDYYSFTYSGVHVVALPEIYVGQGPQARFTRWLEADLGAAQRNPAVRWIVAFDHRPFYSSGQRHGSYASFVHNELPVLEAHHVDLVISGHEHNYERTLPMRSGAAVSHDPAHVRRGEGTVYVVTGGGGAGIYDDFGPEPAYDAVRAVRHEHVRVDVTPDAMHVVAVTDFGAVIDDFTISR